MEKNSHKQILKAKLPEDILIDDQKACQEFAAACPIMGQAKEPEMLVRPKNSSQVELFLKIANEQGINISLASSKPPHYRGGTGSDKENIGLDLSGMDSVLWINRRNRVVQIEPGVNWSPLLDALAAKGMTLPMPLAPRSGKSVLASVMDREPGTWPKAQWDIADPAASTEFYFGSGERFRTGSAGGPGSLEQQRAVGGAQKCPTGPSQTDFHRVVGGSQGTMGIFTWVFLRTELLPSIQRPWLLGHKNLERLLPFVYKSQHAGLGEQCFVADSTALSLLLGGTKVCSFEKAKKDLAPWTCLINTAGFLRMPKSRIAWQIEDLAAIAKESGLEMAESQGGISSLAVLHAASRPCESSCWRRSLTGGCLSLIFLSTLNKTPFLVDAFSAIAKEHNLARNDWGVYIQPIVQNHACHVEILAPFDISGSKSISSFKSLEQKAVKGLAEAGAYFSRPYGSAGKVAFMQNPAGYDLLKTIKGIFDPNRVLQRGKWGL